MCLANAVTASLLPRQGLAVPLRSLQQPQLRIAVDVTRFDGAPNGNVILDAGWLLLNQYGDVVRLGRFVRRASAGPDIASMVQAQTPFSPSSGRTSARSFPEGTIEAGMPVETARRWRGRSPCRAGNRIVRAALCGRGREGPRWAASSIEERPAPGFGHHREIAPPVTAAQEKAIRSTCNEKTQASADAQRRPPLPYAGRPACPHKSGGLSFPPVTDFHQRAGKALRAKRRGELPEGRLLWKQATATMIFPFGEAQHFGIADETADVWGRNAPPTKGGRGYPLGRGKHPQAADPYAGRDVRRKAPSLPSPDGSTGSSLP
ncbi:MAG: ABC-type transport auxiliary lipoprotein family protein [Bilophila sp.]